MRIIFSVELDPARGWDEDEAMSYARDLARELWGAPVVSVRIEGVSDETDPVPRAEQGTLLPVRGAVAVRHDDLASGKGGT